MSEKQINLEALATMMRRAIYAGYSATLVGSPARVTERYQKRASDPQIGDLVIESSTVWGMRHENATDLDGIGILEEVALEDVEFGDPDFVWDEAVEGRPRPQERVYYLRTFDGRRFRWVNARIVAAVSDLEIITNL